MRKRLSKQIDDAKIFGIQSFCKDLLEVSDILGMMCRINNYNNRFNRRTHVLGHACDAVPKEEVNDNNPHLKGLFEGLTMTKAQLNTVFKRNGLEQVNPIDEKFNPNYHEALFQQEVPNKEPNTVVVVSKIGYKLHDRVIRPALVGVSK
jgi:molecular chaperone GrpE